MIIFYTWDPFNLRRPFFSLSVPSDQQNIILCCYTISRTCVAVYHKIGVQQKIKTHLYLYCIWGLCMNATHKLTAVSRASTLHTEEGRWKNNSLPSLSMHSLKNFNNLLTMCKWKWTLIYILFNNFEHVLYFLRMEIHNLWPSTGAK